MLGKVLLLVAIATICDAAFITNWPSQVCSTSCTASGRQVTTCQDAPCGTTCFQTPCGTACVRNVCPSTATSYKKVPIATTTTTCVETPCGAACYQETVPNAVTCASNCFPNNCQPAGTTCVQTPCGTTCFPNGCPNTIGTTCVPQPRGTTPCFPTTCARDEALFRYLRNSVAASCDVIDAQTMSLLNRYFCHNGGNVLNGCRSCFDVPGEAPWCRNGASFGKYCCNELGCTPNCARFSPCVRSRIVAGESCYPAAVTCV